MTRREPRPPARVTLVESSGPVSPRYQYALTVEVTWPSDGDARVRVTHRRPRAAGGDAEASTIISAERFQRLWGEVWFGASTDLAPADDHRIGVSTNRLSLEEAGAPQGAFTYRLHHLELDENLQWRARVAHVKALADEVLAGSEQCP